MKYAHRQLFPSTHNLAVHLYPSFSPTSTIARRDFSSEHSPPAPLSPPSSKGNRFLRTSITSEKYRLTRLHRLSRDYRRENIFRYSLEGGNLFLRRPRLTNREEKRAISVPRFETTWPRMGWNLWRKRSRTRI